jgi:hypothetical protein
MNPFQAGAPEGPSSGHVRPLGGGADVPLSSAQPVVLAGATLYRTPDGRLLAPAFRGFAVDLGAGPLPDEDDEDAMSGLVLRWVEAVHAHDWAAHRGTELEGDEDWVDLRSAIARIGWGPSAALAAWEAVRDRPYSRDLPTAAGWAGAGWVVPAAPGEPEPAFARPVLEARGLYRWAYIARWQAPAPIPDGPLPLEPEPVDLGWADVLSRLRQDHHTQDSLGEAEQLAIELLELAGLGPANPIEAEDEPLPDRHVAAAAGHHSPLVRAAAWFLLRDDAEAWLACTYNECGHHWAVEAEEDAYEMEEVLELAARGVANPVDAAYQRRRLLTRAFGDISDVPLAGAGDLDDFLAFYDEWSAHGQPEEAFDEMVEELRGDSEG